MRPLLFGILLLHDYYFIFILMHDAYAATFLNYFLFSIDPYCQLKHSHPTTHYECKFMSVLWQWELKSHSLFRRDALKGHYFVIKRENETNIMLQYLSFLSDQRKKNTLSARNCLKERENENERESGRKSVKEREVREWRRKIVIWENEDEKLSAEEAREKDSVKGRNTCGSNSKYLLHLLCYR